jgi:hypothetical protein
VASRSPSANSQMRWAKLWLFLIPTLVALLQSWASQRILVQLTASPLDDGAHYIGQARLLQDEPFTLQRFLELGLYPLFLSQFDLELGDMSVASTDPKLLAVYAAQSLMLSATSAVFLFCAFILIPGHLLKRVVICALLGGILLSPLVVVWPTMVMYETMAIPATLLFACACLSDDSGRRWSLILIAMACCLLLLVRVQTVFFVFMFAGLLWGNILFSKTNWTRPLMIGAALMLLATGLGIAKASWLLDRMKDNYGSIVNYSQVWASIIQVRILPDPEHRKFFVERGLPISSTMMERSGKPAWVDNKWFTPENELSESPDFIAYRNWVLEKGRRTYLTFLLTHPGYLLRSIAHSPNVLAKCDGDLCFSITDLLSLPMRGYETSLAPYPPWLRDFLLAPFGWLIPTLYLVVTAIRYIWQTATRQRASSLEIAALAAGGAVFVTYHADAWDPWRHTLPFVLLIYITLIMRTGDIFRELIRLVRRPLPERASGSIVIAPT